MNIVLAPIGYVKNSRKDIADDYWGSVISEIELAEDIPAESLDEIESFSHLEIVFYFDQTDKSKIKFKRRPRGNEEWPEAGIFSQRAKDRPNSIGLTIVELVKRNERTITLRYLDAIDGTPVLDIKPVMKEFLPANEIRQSKWSEELMKDYWKESER